MTGSLNNLRLLLPWLLGALILGTAYWGRIRALVEDAERIRVSPPGQDHGQIMLAELDKIRPNLPPRGRLSLLQQGEAKARALRPLIDKWSHSILAYYDKGTLPADPAAQTIVREQAELLRPRFPGLAKGELPELSKVATLLEMVHFATLDAAQHTLAQYALVPLIVEPTLQAGLVLARLPKGKARAEAIRLGLRWKKAVGHGWYLLEKRP